nr:hypothetical protein [uncultured Halomonas sp.]
MVVKPLAPMTKETFKKTMEEKGWNPDLLALRWNLKRRRVYQIIDDESRPRYYDDALRGLPIIEI